MADSAADRDALYQQAAEAYSGAIERLARGYEPDPDKRRDLVQDIHVALWRSFAQFAGRASMRTWVYRVAHNTAISRITRRRAHAPTFVTLDELAETAVEEDALRTVDRRIALERLLALIQSLDPLDRQVILLDEQAQRQDASGDDRQARGESNGCAPNGPPVAHAGAAFERVGLDVVSRRNCRGLSHGALFSWRDGKHLRPGGLPPGTRYGLFVLVLIVAGVILQALWWMIRRR